MQIEILKSKLHRATVTHADLHYEGSIGIDAALMRAAGLIQYEKVDVANIANGARFTTYVIEQPGGSGEIIINGAAAHLCSVGDLVIIMNYCILDAKSAAAHKPTIIKLNTKNEVVK